MMRADVTDVMFEGGRAVGCAGHYARRGERSARRSDCRCRWPAFDRAREGRPQGAGLGRSDGRAVDANLATAGRPKRDARSHRSRTHVHHAQSRRLLAMCLRHSQRRDRTGAHAGLPAFRARIRRALRRGWAIASRSSRPGTTSSCSPSRSIGWSSGTRPAFCASAMRPTPCRRSAASGSISPFRMRSPPRTFFTIRCAGAGRASRTSSAVQHRREFPMRVIQRHSGAHSEQDHHARTRQQTASDRPGRCSNYWTGFPPAANSGRIVGIGVQREHVRTPDVGTG